MVGTFSCRVIAFGNQVTLGAMLIALELYRRRPRGSVPTDCRGRSQVDQRIERIGLRQPLSYEVAYTESVSRCRQPNFSNAISLRLAARTIGPDD